jgi:Protein of unknown function (DUF1573)
MKSPLIILLVSISFFSFQRKNHFEAPSILFQEPRMSFLGTEKNLGRFPASQEQKVTFDFKNDGEGTLKIDDCTSTCECIKIDFPKKPFEKGSSGKISVTYKDSKMIGSFSRTVTVFTNEQGGEKRHTLTIKGVGTSAVSGSVPDPPKPQSSAESKPIPSPSKPKPPSQNKQKSPTRKYRN